MRRVSGRVTIAAVLALAACTGDPSAERRPGPRPLEVTGDLLAPGTYATSDFSERLMFDVGSDPWIVRQEEPAIVTLTSPRAELAFATPRRVYEKVERRFVPRARPLPDDLVAWLASRPDLDAGEPSSVRVGGRPATAIDVEVRELYEEAELLGCPLPCLPLAPGGTAEPLFLTHTHRVLVFDGTPPLVVVYSTGDADGERAVRALLETVRFPPLSAR